MSILAWLKGLRRRRLDDEDFQEEIRAHLKIAADEKMADGADRRNAQLASLKDFGNVMLTLGIGLNAGVFTMLKGIALSPIAGVERSAQLVTIFGETSAGRGVDISYPDYQYLRDHDQAFTGLFGSSLAKVGLGRGRSA